MRSLRTYGPSWPGIAPASAAPSMNNAAYTTRNSSGCGALDSCADAVLYRQDHPVADEAGLVPAEELHLGEQPELHRDEALPGRVGAQLVERVPQPLPGEAEPHLSGRVQHPAPLFGDIDCFKPALAQLAEAGDREQ